MVDVVKACENKEKPYSFISYSHDDADKVYPILKQLNIDGYRLWYDRHIESGRKWPETIAEWLMHDNCVKFIIFISQKSLESEYVQDEVYVAREHKKSCLVVYLEAVEMTPAMKLQLGRWQSINWYENDKEVFLQLLMKGIPANTIELSETDDGDDLFLQKYQLLDIIGKGGSSNVYKANMKSTGAIVTVKVANCSVTDKNLRNQIIHNEKKVLAQIRCPFIPDIIDFGEAVFDGETKYYLVESYIPGKNLSEIRCPLSESEVVMIILKIAQILQYLHINGNEFVHSDIKPENIIIDDFNNCHLIDFGGCVKAHSSVNWGTTTFAAPEQNRGGFIDVRSDIYSLGITMKYLLEKDFLRLRGISFKDNISKSVLDTTPKVSYILALIVEKMIDPRVERRFQSLEELIVTLEEFQEKNTDSPRLILKKNYYYKDDLTAEEKLRELFITTQFGSVKLRPDTDDRDRQLQEELRKLFAEDTSKAKSEVLHHSAVLNLSVSVVAPLEDDSDSVQLPPTPSVITIGI